MSNYRQIIKKHKYFKYLDPQQQASLIFQNMLILNNKKSSIDYDILII